MLSCKDKNGFLLELFILPVLRNEMSPSGYGTHTHKKKETGRVQAGWRFAGSCQHWTVKSSVCPTLSVTTQLPSRKGGWQFHSFPADLCQRVLAFNQPSNVAGAKPAMRESNRTDPKPPQPSPNPARVNSWDGASAADESLLRIVTFAHLSKSALSPVRITRCSGSCDDWVFTACHFMKIFFADAERILYTQQDVSE